MPANEYQFVTAWEVAGTPDKVFDILDDPADLAQWWPSVYLDVVVEEPGDERGIGKVVSVLTNGWLPYKLRWGFRVMEKARPNGVWSRVVFGEFSGGGLLLDAVDEDRPLDDLGQQRRTVQRTQTL